MNLIQSGDVREIAELAPSTFDEWCRDGIITPEQGGDGQGDHRRFTVMQTVAVTFGNQLRKRDGVALKFVKDVIEYIASLSCADVEKVFEKGRTHVFPAKPFQLMGAWSGCGDEFNLEETYHSVMAKIDRIANRQTAPTRGRTRGLIETAK